MYTSLCVTIYDSAFASSHSDPLCLSILVFTRLPTCDMLPCIRTASTRLNTHTRTPMTDSRRQNSFHFLPQE